MPAKPVAVYLRVSTDDQSHASQRKAVEDWLAAEGVDPEKVEWYQDTESGRTTSRKDFERLSKDIGLRRRKTVIVFKLDRISRDMVDGMVILSEWCKAGARVVSLTERLDLAGTVGKIIAAVLLGFAEIEWTVRRERQASGIRAARERGVYKGRARGTTKAQPARARELRKKGLTVAEIATALGVSESSAFRYLRG